jgi:hypothetical protein
MAATGKSFLMTMVKESMIEGTYDEISHESKLAITDVNGPSLDDLIRFYDEVPLSLGLSSDSATNGKSSTLKRNEGKSITEGIYKTLLTEGKIFVERMEPGLDGKMTTTKLERNAKIIIIGGTNYEVDKMSEPLSSRWPNITCPQTVRISRDIRGISGLPNKTCIQFENYKTDMKNLHVLIYLTHKGKIFLYTFLCFSRRFNIFAFFLFFDTRFCSRTSLILFLTLINMNL